ncbi:C39 family peptidase [Cupriavidus necator]|uniref:C39 family peptidase n=1 Tax=Cupriavidus necator TaxID=106590 RepID=UPI0027801A6B|nr:C39 family peptidase [Cupriavidus necator]MDQ0140865.1 putative double-glycine peptidase [Cupriavidus necator]
MHRRTITLLALALAQVCHATASARPPVRSWKTMRDEGVVKQQYDYSCGAAALATLLQHYYGEAVSEADVLQQIAAKGPATLSSLSAAARHFGYEARGYALSLEALRQVNLPAIVFLHVGNDNHFSVLRSIDAHAVALADPSLGNRIYSATDFLRLWTTRPSRDYPGRALIVMPRDASRVGNRVFTRPIPARFSGLTLRPFRP